MNEFEFDEETKLGKKEEGKKQRERGRNFLFNNQLKTICLGFKQIPIYNKETQTN